MATEYNAYVLYITVLSEEICLSVYYNLICLLNEISGLLIS